MIFDERRPRFSLIQRQRNGELRVAAAPAREPALLQQFWLQRMLSGRFGTGERDGGLDLWAGANALGDKKARAQQCDAHGR